MAIERHIYPGGNTPKGFFSYYSYILGQREANRIVCIKGGPGVGKSSFIRKIGNDFLAEGENVDFMHCSSDADSLDGIVLKDRKIAFIDATSPHIVDPISPGAVDDIIHLGEYWDEKGIRKNKLAVIEKGEIISKWYARAYNYLGAAEKLYDNAAAVYNEAVESAEIYKIAAEIVGKELSHKEICLRPGNIKKYFASAITPSGFVNYLPSIAEGCKKIYLISAPFGASAHSILDIFAEGAVYRGFAVEEYFCPLKPDSKMEHLVIPELSLAFITANEYHDVEPWQLPEGTDSIELLDMSDMANASVIERRKKLLEESESLCDMMMKKAVGCIEEAKKEHDVLESYYIPNMDFKKIDELRDEIIAKIRLQEV
ncbi:MAG: ATPase [Firmicutes bacterium]|nr:ATPase [Bacillota bacterium]